MRYGDHHHKSGDLIQIVSKEDATINTRAYEDWLVWDPSLEGKLGVILEESRAYSSSIRIFCDGKEIWTVSSFVKKA